MTDTIYDTEKLYEYIRNRRAFERAVQNAERPIHDSRGSMIALAASYEHAARSRIIAAEAAKHLRAFATWCRVSGVPLPPDFPEKPLVDKWAKEPSR